MSVKLNVKMAVDLTNLDDEILVEQIQNGNRECLDLLIKKYQKLVHLKAKSYFLIGADKEDIIQEGMIGLYKAIRDFKRDRMTAFKSFAEHCIFRQIMTAIKSASRKKHSPLNSYISLDKPIYDDESNVTLLDVMPEEKLTNPELIILKKETVNDMEIKISESLSPLEQKVLAFYLDGHSYLEISDVLKKSTKTIDNALQRARKKLSIDIPKLDITKERKAVYLRMYT